MLAVLTAEPLVLKLPLAPHVCHSPRPAALSTEGCKNITGERLMLLSIVDDKTLNHGARAAHAQWLLIPVAAVRLQSDAGTCPQQPAISSRRPVG
jgi:hypothetical protein